MRTLRDLSESIKTLPNKTTIAYMEDGKRKTISTQEAYKFIYETAQFWLLQGFKKEDRVTFIADNIPEWILVSLSLSYAGFIDVPNSTSVTDKDLKHMLAHSESRIAIVQDKKSFEKVEKNRSKVLEDIIFVKDIPKKVEKSLRENKIKIDFPKLISEDTASILYTSGTTGNPKGVELSHWNHVSNAIDAIEYFGEIINEKLISFLPPKHVFGRVEKNASS